MSTSSTKITENDEEFSFSSTTLSGSFNDPDAEVSDNSRENDPNEGENQVDEEVRDVDVRDLKNVSSFEAVAYHLYINNFHSEVLSAVTKVMDAYNDFEGKALNIKQIGILVDTIRQLEEHQVTKEEAQRLQENAYMVSNTFAQKIKIFLSQKNGKHAIVSMTTNTILYTDCDALADFVSAELCRTYELGQNRDYVLSWVNCCKQTIKNHKEKVNFSFLNRIKNSSSPLNQYMAAGEMVQFTEELRDVVVTMSPEDKTGVTTKVHFASKVFSESDKDVMSVVSTQLMSAFASSIQREDKRTIVQIEYGLDNPSPPTQIDGVVTWKLAKEGPGSEEHFNPKSPVLQSEDDELCLTSDGVARVLRKVKYRGIVLTKTKIFLKAQWESRMNNETLAQMNTVGFVHSTVFNTLYARIKKGGLFSGVDPQTVIDAHRFILVDPLSRVILAIPKQMLVPDSLALSNSPELGMVVRKGLLKVLHLFTSAFTMGLLKCPDWNALDPEVIKGARSDFLRAKDSMDKRRYETFVDVMVKTLNQIKPVAIITKGSKKISDPDVTKYFADQDWEMDDNSYHDDEIDEEVEDIDF